MAPGQREGRRAEEGAPARGGPAGAHDMVGASNARLILSKPVRTDTQQELQEISKKNEGSSEESARQFFPVTSWSKD